MTHKIATEVYCLSYFYAKQKYREDLIKALVGLIELTRAEKGCLQYELLMDNENPNFFIMLEKFSTQQDLVEHEQKSYIKYFVENQMEQYCEKVNWHIAREISGES